MTGGYDAGLVFPMPTTHPIASFLEPLVSNALCLKDKDVVLRQVIDKFGRKKSGFPHMDNEGIGCLGMMHSMFYHCANPITNTHFTRLFVL